jgi:excisionase family DNA binding protein
LEKQSQEAALDPDFLTVGEAAARLSVTPTTLRNWDKAGKLKAHRHPINGYRLYKTADIEALKDAIRCP